MKNTKSISLLIWSSSILVPVLVAILFFLPKSEITNDQIYLLPKLNAILNASTSLLLIAGFLAIRKGKKRLHKRIMLSALLLSILFLLSYVSYHSLAESTPFGGEGLIRSIYYFILLSHILLAIVIVPLVLVTFSRALSDQFDKHRKIAKITLPLWLYVTVTGVIVYLMISPYY